MVECAIGIFKEQFPCLDYLRIRSPKRISNVIYACGTLHNMQNYHKHGSYAYDDVLNRIANREEIADLNHEHDGRINDGQNDDGQNVDGVERQREFLEHFRGFARR